MAKAVGKTRSSRLFALDDTASPTCTIDSKGRFKFINRALAELMGYSPKEMLNRHFEDFLHPEDATRVRTLLLNGDNSEDPLREVEARVLCRDGSALKLFVKPSKTLSGRKTTAFQAALTDLTKLKETEKASEESGKFFTLALDYPKIFVIYDSERRIRFINLHGIKIGGLSEQNMIGHRDEDFIPAKVTDSYLPFLKLAAETGKPQTTEFTVAENKNAHTVVVDYVPIPDRRGEVNQILGVIQDITERKKLELEREQLLKKLEAEHARLKAVVEQMPCGVIIAESPSGRLTMGNLQVEKIWRRSFIQSNKIAEYTAYHGFHPDGRIYRAEEWPLARSVRKGEVVLSEEIRFLRGDNTFGVMRVNSTPIRNSEGHIEGGVAIFFDATELKQIEEELQLSEKRFRIALKDSPISAATLDRDLRYTWIYNPQLGYRSEEMLGKRPDELILSKDDAEAWIDFYNGVLTSGLSQRAELSGQTARGTLHVDMYAEPLRNDWGKITGIVSSATDITYFKRAEEELRAYAESLEVIVEERTKQLRDSERLAAIGQTAAMVGHDIRNPLQSITGAVYLAKEELSSIPESEEKKSIGELLETIDEQTQYINKIVADLQSFAGPIILQTQEVDLCQLIRATLSTIPIHKNIKVSITVAENFPRLRVDHALMRRVFTNLFTNAVQAMPEKGELTIKAVEKEESAFISVEDTGIGIAEEAKPKIFQPLFTTKAKGQGFGLAVCKRVVEAHGGTIAFDSQLGKGSIFTVRLPLPKEMH